MKTITEIFTSITNESALVEKSLYASFGDCKLRVSDHLPCVSQTINNNEEKNIFFVFVNANYTESEIQDRLSEIEEKGINTDYAIIENDDDVYFAVLQAKRYLNI